MTRRSISYLVPIAGIAMTMGMAGCNERTPGGSTVDQTEVSEPPSEGSPTGGPRLRAVYVPAYSHLPARDDRKNLLSILLSVRNVDSSAVITLTHVDYFDTSGHRVRRYLGAPRQLRPLETAEFTVDTFDDVGGSGANFLVYWEGPSDAHPLLTEAVMWGHMGAGYMSFTSRGVELDRRPDPAAFMIDAPPGPADTGLEPDPAPTAP